MNILKYIKIIQTIIICGALITCSYLLSHPVVEVVGASYMGYRGDKWGKWNWPVEIKVNK